MMLSRIADSMYWLSRYTERAEGLLRTLHTCYTLSLDKGPEQVNHWRSVLSVYTNLSEEEMIPYLNNPSAAVYYLLLEPQNHYCIRSIFNKARENARGMQDHITKEVWEQVNHMYHLINSTATAKKIKSNNQIDTIELLLKNCLLYTGITDSTMPRGLSWSFMSLGKHIERCLITLELADKQFKTFNYDMNAPKDILFWRPLLFSLSGYEFYLKNYRGQDTCKLVANQTLFNTQFPHSIIYALKRVQKYLDDVLKENDPPEKYSLLNQFGRLYSNVEFADDAWIQRNGLQAYLDETRGNIFQFTRILSQTFFSYS